MPQMVPPSTTKLPGSLNELLLTVAVLPVVRVRQLGARAALDERPATSHVDHACGPQRPGALVGHDAIDGVADGDGAIPGHGTGVGDRPLSVRPAKPLPDGPAVRVPSFSRRGGDGQAGRGPPPPMPTVSVLPDETVSSPTPNPVVGDDDRCVPRDAGVTSAGVGDPCASPVERVVPILVGVGVSAPVQLSLQVNAAAAGALVEHGDRRTEHRDGPGQKDHAGDARRERSRHAPKEQSVRVPADQRRQVPPCSPCLVLRERQVAKSAHPALSKKRFRSWDSTV